MEEVANTNYQLIFTEASGSTNVDPNIERLIEGQPDTEMPQYYQSAMVCCSFNGANHYFFKYDDDVYFHTGDLKSIVSEMFEGVLGNAKQIKQLEKLALAHDRIKIGDYIRDENPRNARQSKTICGTSFVSLRVTLKFLETKVDLWGLDASQKVNQPPGECSDTDNIRVLLNLLSLAIEDSRIPNGADISSPRTERLYIEIFRIPTLGVRYLPGPKKASRPSKLLLSNLSTTPAPESSSSAVNESREPSSSSTSAPAATTGGASSLTSFNPVYTGKFVGPVYGSVLDENDLKNLFDQHKDALTDLFVDNLRVEMEAVRSSWEDRYGSFDQLGSSEEMKDIYQCLVSCKEHDARVAPTLFSTLLRLTTSKRDTKFLTAKKNDPHLLRTLYAGQTPDASMFAVKRSEDPAHERIISNIETGQLVSSLLIQIILSTQLKSQCHSPWPFIITTLLKKCDCNAEGLMVLADLRIGVSHTVGKMLPYGSSTKSFDRTGSSASHLKAVIGEIMQKPEVVRYDRRFTKSEAPVSGTWKRALTAKEIANKQKKMSAGEAVPELGNCDGGDGFNTVNHSSSSNSGGGSSSSSSSNAFGASTVGSKSSRRNAAGTSHSSIAGFTSLPTCSELSSSMTASASAGIDMGGGDGGVGLRLMEDPNAPFIVTSDVFSRGYSLSSSSSSSPSSTPERSRPQPAAKRPKTTQETQRAV